MAFPAALVAPLVLAWITKEAVGEGSGLLDTFLYHLGYDENTGIRRWTDFLDELGTINSIIEDIGMAPRRADTSLGENIGMASSVLDFFVPVGQIPGAIRLTGALGKGAKTLGYASKAGAFAKPVTNAMSGQQFMAAPFKFPLNNVAENRGQQGAVGFWQAGQFPAMGNVGDAIAHNLNTAAAMYPHLWAQASAEQARRDRENRAALENAIRQYAMQASQYMSAPLGYEVPRFW